MLKTGLTHEDAFTFVQARRFCVAPRTEFVHQLEVSVTASASTERTVRSPVALAGLPPDHHGFAGCRGR